MARNDRQNIYTELIAQLTGLDTPQQSLVPEKLLVVAGILAGLLDVSSVLFGRDGRVDIVLTGIVKGKDKGKTKL